MTYPAPMILAIASGGRSTSSAEARSSSPSFRLQYPLNHASGSASPDPLLPITGASSEIKHRRKSTISRPVLVLQRSGSIRAYLCFKAKTFQQFWNLNAWIKIKADYKVDLKLISMFRRRDYDHPSNQPSDMFFVAVFYLIKKQSIYIWSYWLWENSTNWNAASLLCTSFTDELFGICAAICDLLPVIKK